MSSIDQRIVEMQFKNSEFEKGIRQSLKSLDNLKEGLDLDNSTKSLKKLQKAGDSFSLAKMADGIETVSSQFTLLGRIGMQAMDDIASSAVNTGKKLVKSLTVDQVTSGWTKYEQKTASVQTIMNATGKSIDEVNAYLDKLMWFSDETSYNFAEMTSALGTMTSSGGKIENLIPMIEGMAAATAYAGKGASEFSRVIYNLNQSYGQGYLSYMDWRSVELANVGSEQLKQTLIDTAVAMGELKESSDGTVKTLKGTLVTAANMSSTLNEKWATSEVMEEAFGKFGAVFQEAYELVQSGQFDTAAEAIASLEGEYDDVYYKAAKAAQEAKTFTEAIEATKDAVSSGWMKSFELIFGNKDEATELWTGLSNALWEVFASGSEARNEMLGMWHDMGGRDDLIQGITDALSALWGIVIAVKDAFSDIFPPVTVDNLLAISDAVKNFGANLKEVLHYEDLVSIEVVPVEFEEQIENLEESLKKGLKGDAVKTLQERLQALGYDVGPAGADGIFGSKTLAGLKEFQKDFGLTVDGVYGEEAHKKMAEALGLGNGEKQFERVGWSVKFFGEALSNVKTIAKGFFSVLKVGLKIVGFLWDVFLVGYNAVLKPVLSVLFKVVTAIFGAFETLGTWLDEASVIFSYFGAVIAEWAAPIGEWISSIGDAIGALLSAGLEKLINLIRKLAKGFKDFFSGIKKNASDLKIFDMIADAFERIKKALGFVKSAFSDFGNKISEWWNKIKPILGKIATIAFGAIAGIIVGALYAIAEGFKKLVEIVEPFIRRIPEYIQKLKDFFGNLWGNFKGTKIGKTFASYAKKIEGIFDKIGLSVDKVKRKFGELTNSLKKGSKGDEVRELQERLRELGYDLGPDGVDGVFGEKTKEALKQFQKDNGLTGDGIYGEETHDKMAEIFSEKSRSEKLKEFGQFIKGLKDRIKESDFVKNKLPALGDKLKEFWETIKNSDFVQNKLPAIGKGIKDFFLSVWEWLKEIAPKIPEKWEKAKKFFSDLWETIKNSDFVQNKLPALGDKLKGFFISIWENIKELPGKFPAAWEKVKKVFADIWAAIKEFFAGSKDEGDSGEDKPGIFERIGNFFKKIGSIFKSVFTGGISLWSILKFIFLIKHVKKLFDTLRGVKQTPAKVAEQIGTNLLKIAEAIGIVVLAIFLLGTMKPEKLKRGAIALGAIIALLGIFVAVGAILQKNNLAKGIDKVGEGLRDMGLAVLSMVAAIYVLGHMKLKTLMKGIMALAAIMAILIITIKMIGKEEVNIKMKGFSQIALVIAVMAIIVRELGKMRIDQLGKGILAIAAITAVLVGFMAAAKYLGKGNLKDFGGLTAILVAFSIFVVAFGYAIRGIKNVKPSAIIAFSASLSIMLVAIVGLCALAGTLGGVATMANGALGIGVAFAILIGIIGGIVVLLGAIDKWTNGGFVSVIESGGKVMQSLGKALGLFFGGFIEGLIVPISGAVKELGEGLTLIDDIDDMQSVIEKAIYAVSTIGTFLKSLDKSGIERNRGGLVKFFAGDNKTNSLLAQIQTFGSTLSSIYDALGGIGEGNFANDVDTAVSAAKEISRFLEELSDVDIKTHSTVFGDWFGGDTKQETILDLIAKFGNAMSSVTTALLGTGDLDLDTATDDAVASADKISAFLSKLSEVDISTHSTVFGDWFGGDTKQEAMLDLINQFGTSMESVVTTLNTVGGLELDSATDDAVASADKISAFLSKLSEVDISTHSTVFGDWFGGDTKQKAMLDLINQFGESMGTVVTNLSAADSETMGSTLDDSLTAAEKIKDFLVKLDEIKVEKKSGWQKFWTGDTTQDSFLSFVTNFSTAINTSATMLKDIGVGDFSTNVGLAKTTMTDFADLLDYITKEVDIGEEQYNSNSGEFGFKFQKIFDGLTDFAAAIVTFDTDTKSVDIERFSSIVSQIQGMFTSLGSISPEELTAATDSLSQLGESIGTGISGGLETGSGTASITDLCGSMLTTLSGYLSDFINVGSNYSKGIGIGIENSQSFAVAKAGFVASQVVNKVRAVFDSHSPSRVAMAIGGFFSEGLGIGIEGEAGAAIASSEAMTNSIIDNTRSGLSTLTDIIEDNMDTEPVVRPVVDLTDVQSSAKTMNGLLSRRTTIAAKASSEAAAATGSSVARRQANQNGKDGVKNNGATGISSEDNSVNLTGNNFYVRSDNDIHLLASEIAALTRSQQLGLGRVH